MFASRLAPSLSRSARAAWPARAVSSISLDCLARLGRLVLDSDKSHDRLLETDRRNLRRSRSRHNLIDAGGSNLPNELAINPWDHVLVSPSGRKPLAFRRSLQEAC